MPDLLAIAAIAVWVSWSTVLAAGMVMQLISIMRGSEKAALAFRVLGRIHQELWLFVPPGILISTVINWHSSHSWTIFFDALGLYNWWRFRNWPDENRWKRRGRKAKEAVTVRGARLVVVPHA